MNNSIIVYKELLLSGERDSLAQTIFEIIRRGRFGLTPLDIWRMLGYVHQASTIRARCNELAKDGYIYKYGSRKDWQTKRPNTIYKAVENVFWGDIN